MTISEFDAPPSDKSELERSSEFTPRFDSSGLITAVVTDAKDSTVLMVAHMNAEALDKTLRSGIAHYWSRSRNALWKKGGTSGNLQHVVEMRTDCDQDAVWLSVNVEGEDASCHTGRRSCFYRIAEFRDGKARLADDGSQVRFDPAQVYGND